MAEAIIWDLSLEHTRKIVAEEKERAIAQKILWHCGPKHTVRGFGQSHTIITSGTTSGTTSGYNVGHNVGNSEAEGQVNFPGSDSMRAAVQNRIYPRTDACRG